MAPNTGLQLNMALVAMLVALLAGNVSEGANSVPPEACIVMATLPLQAVLPFAAQTRTSTDPRVTLLMATEIDVELLKVGADVAKFHVLPPLSEN